MLSAMSARLCEATAVLVVTLLTLLVVTATFPSRGDRQGHALRVATYNIWNIMFNWDVRKHHIAAMIRAADVDVVALQEVRADIDEKRTQLLELKALLPSYRWHAYHPGQKVIPHKGAPPGWEMEGLGILSRYPITATSLQPLTHQSPKDKNQRTVLHASLGLGPGLNASLALVHLSYDIWQQCVNVAEIMKHIRGTKPKHSIILGDFNTYIDYPWPLEGLLNGYFSTTNKCPRYAAQKNPTSEAELVSYKDAWAEVNPNKNGFTFSNMPQPGFQSRPDRILFSKSWQVNSCQLLGRGEEYAKTYPSRITWTRLTTLLRSAEDSFYATTTTPGSCVHDCGPHGSCRCGICVSGGDKNRCMIPNCPECSAHVYRNYLIIKVLFIILFVQFLVSLVLFVLQRRARWKPAHVISSGSSSLIYCHCLFSNRYSATPKVPRSRLCIVHVLRFIWPLLYMRPSYQLFVCGVCCVLLFVLCFHLFEGALQVVFAVLPEELNPSDHLMVVATATVL